jgi:hypothetical protein
MSHVFSDKIIEVSKTLNCYPEEEFARLTNAYRNVRRHLLYTSTVVVVNSNILEIDEEKMYEIILGNREIQDIIYWINKNILTQLDTLESKTLEVRLRIATSMLNKVIQNYGMNSLIGIIIHDNFVKNLKELYYDLNMDQLPF